MKPGGVRIRGFGGRIRCWGWGEGWWWGKGGGVVWQLPVFSCVGSIPASTQGHPTPTPPCKNAKQNHSPPEAARRLLAASIAPTGLPAASHHIARQIAPQGACRVYAVPCEFDEVLGPSKTGCPRGCRGKLPAGSWRVGLSSRQRPCWKKSYAINRLEGAEGGARTPLQNLIQE